MLGTTKHDRSGRASDVAPELAALLRRGGVLRRRFGGMPPVASRGVRNLGRGAAAAPPPEVVRSRCMIRICSVSVATHEALRRMTKKEDGMSQKEHTPGRKETIEGPMAPEADMTKGVKKV